MVQDDQWTDIFQAALRPAQLGPEGSVMPPIKEHPPELVVCAYCGYVIEDGWWRFHPCPEREEAQRQRERDDEQRAGEPR